MEASQEQGRSFSLPSAASRYNTRFITSNLVLFFITFIPFVHLLGWKRAGSLGNVFIPLPRLWEGGAVTSTKPRTWGIFMIIPAVNIKGAPFMQWREWEKQSLTSKREPSALSRGRNKTAFVRNGQILLMGIYWLVSLIIKYRVPNLRDITIPWSFKDPLEYLRTRLEKELSASELI